MIQANCKRKKKYGEVFTPTFLIEKMLDTLPCNVWQNPNLKWLDPSCGSSNFLVCIKNRLMNSLRDAISNQTDREQYILEKMLFGVDLSERNVIISRLRLDPQNQFALNFAIDDALDFHFWNQKYDIVVGNPPYQCQNDGEKHARRDLWPKFVDLALDSLVVNDGYLLFVHPPKWRKPNHPLWKKMLANHLVELHIHNDVDGRNIFGADTRFDWYLLQKKNQQLGGFTRTVDEKGCIHNINLQTLPFLPNYNFDRVFALVGLNTKGIIYSRTLYGCDRKHMSQNLTDEHKYPCIYSMRKNENKLLYSNVQKGHFGVPKVIVSIGENPYPYNDYRGEFGICNNAFGIEVQDKDDGDRLCKALKSKYFAEIFDCTKWTNFNIDQNMFTFFKDNFYKEISDV